MFSFYGRQLQYGRTEVICLICIIQASLNYFIDVRTRNEIKKSEHVLSLRFSNRSLFLLFPAVCDLRSRGFIFMLRLRNNNSKRNCNLKFYFVSNQIHKYVRMNRYVHYFVGAVRAGEISVLTSALTLALFLILTLVLKVTSVLTLTLVLTFTLAESRVSCQNRAMVLRCLHGKSCC
jgi:hypothetical protein